jgi:putative glutamine amidotransferase
VRPVIGITTYHETLRFRQWEIPAAVLPRAYSRALFAAGGQPVLLPALPGHDNRLEPLDGLMLSGGGDVSPACYGKRVAGETLLDPSGERDRAELELIEGALHMQLPVLGICRGLQLINVARGGTLVSHLPDVVGHDGHKETPGVFSEHIVETVAGSRTREVLGERAEVKSHHHQAIDTLGRGIRVSGRADDGTIEAIELPDSRFALAVQWHPEAGDDVSLFAALVEAAVAYTEERK